MAGASEPAQLLQSTTEPSSASEVPALKLKRPRSGPEDTQEVQVKRSKHDAEISINGQPHDREQNIASDKESNHISDEPQSGSLTWQCQHSSQVSIASAGCASARITVGPRTCLHRSAASLEHDQDDPSIQAAGKGPASSEGSASALPQLRVTLQWYCRPPAGSEEAASTLLGAASAQHTRGTPLHQPRCRISSEPCIPESAAQELAAMAGTYSALSCVVNGTQFC